MCKLMAAGFVIVCAGTSHVAAWEFRTRFVQRVGNTDTVVPSNFPISIPDNEPTRYRIQFGVFDDADSAAPAGGFVGWNIGTIHIEAFQPFDAGARRTPGRLAPFNFSQQNGANGNPNIDPFPFLTDIDCTMGTQSPIWTGCDADGNPTPQPPAVVRGLNTFVSIYEVTVTPTQYYLVFSLQFQGNLIAATDWRTIGLPDPPNCDDPMNPIPGNVTYVPLATRPQPFTATLVLVSNGVPSPGTAPLLALTAALAARRRR